MYQPKQGLNHYNETDYSFSYHWIPQSAASTIPAEAPGTSAAFFMFRFLLAFEYTN